MSNNNSIEIIRDHYCLYVYFNDIFYIQLSSLEKDDEMQHLFGSDEALDMLEAIGYRGNPHRATLSQKQIV